MHQQAFWYCRTLKYFSHQVSIAPSPIGDLYLFQSNMWKSKCMDLYIEINIALLCNSCLYKVYHTKMQTQAYICKAAVVIKGCIDPLYKQNKYMVKDSSGLSPCNAYKSYMKNVSLFFKSHWNTNSTSLHLGSQ